MVSTLILQTHQGMVKIVTVLLRKEMFSGLLCLIDKVAAMTVGAMMTWNQIQIHIKIDGRERIKKVVV